MAKIFSEPQTNSATTYVNSLAEDVHASVVSLKHTMENQILPALHSDSSESTEAQKLLDGVLYTSDNLRDELAFHLENMVSKDFLETMKDAYELLSKDEIQEARQVMYQCLIKHRITVESPLTINSGGFDWLYGAVK